MPPQTLLGRYGLARNPFTDRTAEKTNLNDVSMYVHSDLQDFKPSEETYLFFGKRGSGKTTIRLTMQEAYEEENARLREAGQAPHFVVDLCKPGHMTSCLKDFMEVLGCSVEDWDSKFAERWTTSDLVDCIYAYTITHIVQTLTAVDGQAAKQADLLVSRLRSNSRLCKSFLIQAHLYGRTDASTLRYLMRRLAPSRLDATTALISATGAIGALATGAYVTTSRRSSANTGSRDAAGSHRAAAPGVYASGSIGSDVNRFLSEGGWELLGAAGALALVATASSLVWKSKAAYSRKRACELQLGVRVVKRLPVEDFLPVLNACVSPADSVDTIRQIHVGVSAHQKLQKLSDLVQLLGYRSLAVFGDCFDEVVLLDPVCYPQSIKQFAKEVCRNDLLNFGRMHFFFPDSRVNLDLNTDKTLKEARFDRHFLRDMSWSRHQLEELAERRFSAAQASETTGTGRGANGRNGEALKFTDLFKEVSGEDFAAYVNKLDTPRELMIMMTEMFNRIEKNPGGKLTAQDMEFAVKQAKEQSA